MDPTGGVGCWLFIATAIVIGLMWIFAPFEWALGVTLILGLAFVIFIVSIFSSARFT